MSILRGLTALIAAVMALFSCPSAMGNTVGLWLFDTMEDTTSFTAGTFDPPGGETLLDSSGNGLDFVSSTDFGTIALDFDTPSLMGVNTYSLNSNNGGARQFKTPRTTLLNRGTTGELTLEFWLQYVAPSPTVGYVASYDGGSTSNRDGDWGIYGDSNGDIIFFAGFGAATTDVRTLDLGQGYDPADGNWNHLAFSVDNIGTLTSYFNGNQVQQSAIGAAGIATPAMTDFVNFGTNPGGFFGAHHFKIDEFRISDTALLPGTGTGVGELAWDTQLGTVPPVLPPRGSAFTDQWLRSRDFTISSWASTNYLDLYSAAGFTAIQGGGPEALAAGVETHFLGAFTQLDNKALTDIQIALNDGYSAFMLKDEIAVANIPGIADVATYIRSVDDQALLIAGLGSTSPSYIDQVITIIQPDAVIHAFYPFQGTSSATDDWGPSLTNMALVRERTLFHDVAYFAYIQTFEDLIAGANTIDDNRRLPTESEFRAEVFSKLSAGVKGFVDFRFQNGISEDFALVNPSGDTSSLYAPVAAANTEIINLGKSLRYLTSSDWRFVSGGVSATPAEILDWDTTAGNGLVDAIVIDGTPTDLKDALVGYFTDDASGEYFMLANMFHGDSLDAAAAAVDYTLTFDSSVNSIWRLNRLTGLVEEIVLTGNVFNLMLPGGTGDLFKFGDGLFPGLATIPGDFDSDGDVDGADFLVWQRGFGDGYDVSDLAVWKSNFGAPGALSTASGATAAVPEPTSFWLLLTATAMLVGGKVTNHRGVARLRGNISTA